MRLSCQRLVDVAIHCASHVKFQFRFGIFSDLSRRVASRLVVAGNLSTPTVGCVETMVAILQNIRKQLTSKLPQRQEQRGELRYYYAQCHSRR